MFGSHFNHYTIRKYMTVVGYIFSNLTIIRRPEGDTTLDEDVIPVKLYVADKQKYYEFENERNSLDSDVKVKKYVPRMKLKMDDLNYSPIRQPNKNNLLQNNTNYQYNRVPYDFVFTLEVETNRTSDAQQIIEQICPYFTPYINLSIKDNKDLGIVSDLMLKLESVSPDNNFEGGMDDSQLIKWRLAFVLEGWLYRPTSQANIIKQTTITVTDYEEIDGFEIDAAVNPLSANKDDAHTIDVTITSI